MLTVIKNPEKTDWKSMPLPEMALGNAYDTHYTYRLNELLNEISKETHYYRVYRKLVQPSIPIFAEIGQQGLMVDQKRLSEISDKLKRHMDKYWNFMDKFAPGMNFSSNKQLMELLFLKEVEYDVEFQEWKEYKTPASKKKHNVDGRWVKRKRKEKAVGFDLDPDKDYLTDAGMPAVSKDAIEFYITQALGYDKKEAVMFLKACKKYKTLAKLYETYAVGITDSLKNTKDGRVYSKYKQDGTVTGRLSCAAAKFGAKKEEKAGVSFHTLPREKDERYNIRDVFICEEDEDFICADYSTIELRILAHCSQDPFMLKAFQEGIDLHSFTASLVYHLVLEEISKDSAERQNSKTVNFATVYGAGMKKIAAQCGLTLEEARFIIERHKEVFEVGHRFLSNLDSFIKTNKCAISLFGRYRRLPEIDSHDMAIKHSCLRKGKNFVIQSSASDVLVAAIIEIWDLIKSNNLPAKVVATVHDSIEIVCKKDYTKQLLPEIDRILKKPKILKESFGLELSVPLEIEYEIGSSFGNGVKIEV